MTNPDELTVAIHAQLMRGSAGGIETNLLSLLRSLDQIERAGSQVVIGARNHSEWLSSHLGRHQRLLEWPAVKSEPSRRSRTASVLEWLRRGLRGRNSSLPGADPQDPFVAEGERLTRALTDMGVRLVHFPYQRYFPTTLPTVFEPWDLQHRHHPEFFAASEIERRERIYGGGCRQARLIVSATRWGKEDLARELGIEPARIAVIRRGPPNPRRRRMKPDEVATHLRELKVPQRFALYPAKTWPHKNHLRLFAALAALRKGGVVVPVVCTGKPGGEHWPRLQRCIRELSLDDIVAFTGHVEEDRLAALFSAAEFLIFPSLFEGLGIPLLEAMQMDLPILSSRVTCLPEIAGDAARYFDPTSVESMSEAILKAWTDQAMLDELRASGRLRLHQFDWTQAARQFAACYRHLAGGGVPDDQATVASITNAAPLDG